MSSSASLASPIRVDVGKLSSSLATMGIDVSPAKLLEAIESITTRRKGTVLKGAF